MNRISGKIISALVLTVLLAVAVHQYTAKQMQTDRAEFLAAQGRRYDRQHTHPQSLPALVFASGVLVGGAVVMYELVAFGAGKLLNRGARMANAGERAVDQKLP